MKRALITGGCGFVGRHLAKRLSAEGHEVVVVDNFTPGSGALSVWPSHLKAPNIHVINRDCREFFNDFAPGSFENIYHLAAVVGGRLTIENDPLAVATDLSIDAELFNWLAKHEPGPKVHYFSSSAAYPISHQTLKARKILSEGDIDLKSIKNPDLTYGWAKLTGEYLARLLHEKYRHDVICYRPFSGYGEDQDLSYPFPSILKRVREMHSKITVWGTGLQSRDFIYIEDCIDGILHLSPQIQDGSAVNLSTGIPTSFNELALTMSKILNGNTPKIENTSDKPEGVFYRVGDTATQEYYGFKAKTTLEEGIRICNNKFYES